MQLCPQTRVPAVLAETAAHKWHMWKLVQGRRVIEARVGAALLLTHGHIDEDSLA